MIDHLPEEVLSLIGNKLDYKSRLNCYLASKLFNSISNNHKQHYITINNSNIDRLLNIENIIKYVQYRKPNLKYLSIDLKNLEDIEDIHILYIIKAYEILSDVLSIYIDQCNIKTINKILSKTNKYLINIKIYKTNEDIEYLEDNKIYNYIDIRYNDKIISNKSFCNSEWLVLQLPFPTLFLEDRIINLKNININNNKKLYLSVSYGKIIDIHKVSMFVDFRKNECDNIYKSCLEDKLFKSNSRLNTIRLQFYCLPNIHEWIKIIELVNNKDITIELGYFNEYSLYIIDLLKSKGITKFKYYTVDKETYLIIKYICLINKNYSYEIIYNNKNEYENLTLKEIENMITEESKAFLYPIKLLSLKNS